LLPVLLIWLLVGGESIFFQQSIFFSKLAVVTFGGAYAVLAYMAQQAVEVFGWLTPNEMLDGLGLAETTPGPLILVTQFVGFIGAYRTEMNLSPATLGFFGSIVTLWVTFTPCFLWIFLGAPYIERLRANTQIAAALSGITSAVVGVVLNLAIWFGMHITFKKLNEVSLLNLSLKIPDPASTDFVSLCLTVLAGILLLWFRLGTIFTLIGCAGVSILFTVIFRGF
jgi:chromate transporter